MELICRESLNQKQKDDVNRLEELCQQYDKTSISLPMEEQTLYLLLYDKGRLLSALTAFFCEPGLCECHAKTHPHFRRRGHFTCLLDTLTEKFPNTDLVFPINPENLEAKAVLTCLDAELWYEEYMMELRIREIPNQKLSISKETNVSFEDTYTFSGKTYTFNIIASDDSSANDENAQICCALFQEQETIGSCHIAAHTSRLYLYDFQIEEKWRRQGLGLLLLSLVLSVLRDRYSGCSLNAIMLQVSSQNIPAMKLYQKAGFRISETLSYYLY